MPQPDWPAEIPRSPCYQLRVDDALVDVLHTSGGDLALLEWTAPLEIEIHATFPLDQAVLRPLSRNIPTRLENHSLRFTLHQPAALCLETPGHPPFFLHALPPETNRPDRADPRVLWFTAGSVHDIGTLHLQPGQTLYLEAGAVVRGLIRAVQADHVRICGRGILDGGHGRTARQGPGRLCVLEGCRHALIEDITMIEPHSWMLVLGACEDVHIRRITQIGTVVSSDGIDVCGSRRVLIEDCCLRNNDDCVALKSLSYVGRQLDGTLDWTGDVEDITVRRCTLWNDRCGNAMEIGFELRCDRAARILFEDIDVLCVHGHGAVFSIHNGDRALVEDVTWRNIRVEHHFDKLIDFRVIRSRYSQDTQRGRIRDILLENIRVTRSPFNEGETKSLITGWSADSPAERLTLRGIFYNGQPVLDADHLDLFTRHARDIRFELLPR